MNQPYDREMVVAGLRQALPYVRLYRDRVFVVKAGGALWKEPAALESLAEQLGVLQELGIRVVLVHGGGPQTTELSERLGQETEFVGGRRVTSKENLEAAIMSLNGTVRTAILSAFRKSGLRVIGVSGVDAGMVRAIRRPPRTVEQNGEPREIDFGEVGDIEAIDPAVLNLLLNERVLPVVSPLSADDEGTVLNVNADTVAAALAVALSAEKLIFLTDTPGLLEDAADPSSLISYVDIEGMVELEAKGAIATGMLPKVTAIRQALGEGVPRVHMVGYRNPEALLVEVFTNEGSGTLVVKDRNGIGVKAEVKKE